ncbi:2,4-dienoyl-CoA reductase-like NADH-dependent reductase (Old Yellow Enzyme family)/thioredoxin reductase [Anaerosolibacter carboniphilus]|uniref:2,4-dienoyl-CoA reductase-like NADH-dependent reductase (Old Yellow Enzyme family)/thioredoxin reductase n=1 Tax=Anaerosolibacter carboniphilus TaxID=1417629 RepID=A0A841KQ41_9FIRM|nr:FAD-dependent oxidoreductase [Anaerosolibacter carboniphilus]MBB6215874.1 2,4-dienoyl-CoA reductase-like NADH-dependent reductase (Old Yellow Enzyme family)/thioredoxin reductase [Anaerosolibacter carboniphilus]
MSTKYPKLFERTSIGKVKLRNRIAMASMGTMADDDTGLLVESQIKYYEARAKGGVGLVMLEGQTVTNKTDPWLFYQTSADTDFQMKQWALAAEAVHAHGAKVGLQLICGLGRNAFAFENDPIPPVSASANPTHYNPNVICRPMTKEEIRDVVERYGRCAARGVNAECDIIEIHAHCGYLLDQFMTPLWNQRADEYGGSFENRMRFITEIYHSIRNAVGPDVPVGVRMPVFHDFEGARTLEEGIEIAKYFENLGMDFFNIDVGCYDNKQWVTPTIYAGDASMAFAAEAVKKAVKIPVMNAGTYTPQTAEDAVAHGKTDIVILGRALIADPDWANKLRNGHEEDIRPCLSCNQYCIGRLYKNRQISCSVNAQAALEKEYAITKSEDPKKVVVVGGGPGGMEAARVAALKGHHVTLFEKSDKLGGQLNVASEPPFKRRIKDYMNWLKLQIEKNGVSVVYNKTITPDSQELAAADQIIVALGSNPIKFPIKGIDLPNVVEVTDAHRNPDKIKGDKIIVAGGGMSGCDCALELAMQGKDVTIVEALPQIAMKETIEDNKVPLLNILKKYGVKQMVNTKVLEFKCDSVVLQNESGTFELPADTAIYAFGMKPESALCDAICDKYSSARAVGDCTQIGQIGEAVREGYFAAWSID